MLIAVLHLARYNCNNFMLCALSKTGRMDCALEVQSQPEVNHTYEVHHDRIWYGGVQPVHLGHVLHLQLSA